MIRSQRRTSMRQTQHSQSPQVRNMGNRVNINRKINTQLFGGKTQHPCDKHTKPQRGSEHSYRPERFKNIKNDITTKIKSRTIILDHNILEVKCNAPNPNCPNFFF